MDRLGIERDRIEESLASVSRDLSDAFAFLDSALALLEHPGELHERATDEQRRLLNQALFEKILVDDNEVVGTVLRSPFAALTGLTTNI